MNLNWEYKRTKNRIKNNYKCKSDTSIYAVLNPVSARCSNFGNFKVALRSEYFTKISQIICLRCGLFIYEGTVISDYTLQTVASSVNGELAKMVVT